LVITYYWPPSGGAGVQRCLKFVKYLSQFGIEPIVVTVDAEKATYPVIDATLANEIPQNTQVYRTNTTEPFNFYKKVAGKSNVPFGGFTNEAKAGIKDKIFRFIRGNIFIPDPRKGWNSHAYQKCVDIIKSEKIELIFTSSPPHSTQLIGLKLKKNFGLPWIADLRDPWTDIYYYKRLNHTSIAKGIDRSYEKAVLESCDKILVVSNTIKEMFVQKSDLIGEQKIVAIPNGYDEDDFQSPSTPSANEFIITYTGTLTADYEIEVLFKALKKVKENNPHIKYKMRFVGGIDPEIMNDVESLGLSECLEIMPYVTHTESVNYLMKSTVLLLAIPNIEKSKGILTGKLFEYLAAKKPIICIGPKQGDAAKIVDESKAGKVFEYENDESLSEYLEELSLRWSENPNIDLGDSDISAYSRRNQTGTLSQIIEQLVGGE